MSKLYYFLYKEKDSFEYTFASPTNLCKIKVKLILDVWHKNNRDEATGGAETARESHRRQARARESRRATRGTRKSRPKIDGKLRPLGKLEFRFRT